MRAVWPKVGEMLDAGTTTRIHPELPIFRLESSTRVVLYTPGHAYATSRSVAHQVEQLFTVDSPGASGGARALANDLTRHGRTAQRAWHDLAERPFEPECLTLYLSNRCNLACSYCYAAPVDVTRARERLRMDREPALNESFPILSEPVIAAAARLVAGHCAAKGKPLTLVLHGGGEPTVHWDLLTRVWEMAARIARDSGIRLWSYIATHGVLSEDRARWLGRHFNLVGLSCDGPPDIHDANRPSATHSATSAAVARTAQVLTSEGGAYVVRATITPASVTRQTEIVDYLCDRLFARAVRFEPAYDGRRAGEQQFRPDDASTFVAHYLQARKAARDRGCALDLSGVRIDEIHGPFCNPLRDVLQLTPDGKATACFLSVGNDAALDEVMANGQIDPATGAFRIDYARAAAQRRQAAAIPARCHNCHNVFHCARDCPDVCLLTEDRTGMDEAGFRCRVQKLLAHHLILEQAGHLAHA